LWLDGITMTWHTPDSGHPWFSDCDIGEYLNHYQDTDTFLRFQTDRITLNAGGVNFLDCHETTADLMTLGNGTMKIDVDNFKVGIGSAITTPDYDLEVHQGGDYTESLLIVDSANAVVKVGGLSPTEGDDGRFIVRDRVGSAYFDVDVYGGKTTNASTMIIATQSLTQFGVGTASPATGTKMELSNTVGQDPEDFLLITGSTADNTHYSGISFKAGTLANVYPSLQVAGSGLGFEINSGSHSSSYTKSIHASLTAASTEASANFKVYNQDSDPIIFAQGDGKVGFGTSSPSYGIHLETAINIGIYGKSSHASAYGVYGEATTGNGVYGFSASGIGVLAVATTGVGAQGQGSTYDFYANGSGTNYGPFTGAHDSLKSKSIKDFEKGMIVISDGKVRKESISNTLVGTKLANNKADKKVFGVIALETDMNDDMLDKWDYDLKGEKNLIINALGEGQILVSDIYGKIENGDYITSSEIEGLGGLQEDDILHNYTVAKCTENIDWSKAKKIEFKGKKFKKLLISCTYHCG